MDGVKAWLVGLHNAAWELELKLVESREEDGRMILLFQVPFWAKHIRIEMPTRTKEE